MPDGRITRGIPNQKYTVFDQKIFHSAVSSMRSQCKSHLKGYPVVDMDSFFHTEMAFDANLLPSRRDELYIGHILIFQVLEVLPPWYKQIITMHDVGLQQVKNEVFHAKAFFRSIIKNQTKLLTCTFLFCPTDVACTAMWLSLTATSSIILLSFFFLLEIRCCLTSDTMTFVFKPSHVSAKMKKLPVHIIFQGTKIMRSTNFWVSKNNIRQILAFET